MTSKSRSNCINAGFLPLPSLGEGWGEGLPTPLTQPLPRGERGICRALWESCSSPLLTGRGVP